MHIKFTGFGDAEAKVVGCSGEGGGPLAGPSTSEGASNLPCSAWLKQDVVEYTLINPEWACRITIDYGVWYRSPGPRITDKNCLSIPKLASSNESDRNGAVSEVIKKQGSQLASFSCPTGAVCDEPVRSSGDTQYSSAR
jgi:hypothetical protein